MKIFYGLILLLAIFGLGGCSIALQQYPQLELERPQVIFQQIIQERDQSHDRNFTSGHHHPEIPKLVFITPWNPSGKQLTIKYSHKLSYISPCWYQLILKNNQIVFQNSQLADTKYLQQLKRSNPSIKILPRVYVNRFQVFKAMASSQQALIKAIEIITQMVQKQQNYDGIVWDSPYDLFVDGKEYQPLNRLIVQTVNYLKGMFQTISSQRQKSNKEEIANKDQLVLFFNMANPSNKKLDLSLYRQLKIDGLLIQNYDTPLDYIQMIKNSIRWIKHAKIAKVKSIFMMLPFFSYKNNQAISTLDAHKQLSQDGIASSGFQKGMCKLLSNKRSKYNIPCYKYFQQAYKILQQEKIAVGFWQGGNGLENYYKFM